MEGIRIPLPVVPTLVWRVIVPQGSADEQLYSEEDLDASMAKIEVIDFMQTVQVNGIMVSGGGKDG